MTEHKTIICKECGNEERGPTSWREGNIRSIMERDGVCFNCGLWIEKIELHDKHTYVINGTRWHDGGTLSTEERQAFGASPGMGCGGRKQIIQLLDSDKVITTNNLWCQGDVPDHFKERIPDNAKFLPDTEAIEKHKNFIERMRTNKK